MQKIEIRILPEADEFLYSLPMILVEEGYKSSYSSAEKIVVYISVTNCSSLYIASIG